MSLIRPSFQETIIKGLFDLESDRPMYYYNVFHLSTMLFNVSGNKELTDQLNHLIRVRLERPLRANIQSVLTAFYNPRFMMMKRAYTKIGGGVYAKEVTRYEMMLAFEEIKDWCFDKVVIISETILFTTPLEIIK